MPTKEVVRSSAGGIECVLGPIQDVINEIKRLFGSRAVSTLKGKGEFLVCSGIFSEVYLVSNEVTEVVKDLFRKGYIPYSAGLYIGRLRRVRPRFIPSVNLLQVIYDEVGPTRALVISEEGLRPFLYGNDVLRKSVLKCFNPVERDEVVGIMGPDGYVYGVAQFKLRSCSDIGRVRDETSLVAKNIFDVGWFLRGGTEARERMFKIS